MWKDDLPPNRATTAEELRSDFGYVPNYPYPVDLYKPDNQNKTVRIMDKPTPVIEDFNRGASITWQSKL
jgi:hypothetical protein